jgi:nitrogen regulatory protein PII
VVTAATSAAVTTVTKTVTGMDAMVASSAPLGDMSRAIGDHLLGGIGFGLMITIAITVAIAIIGTTLSCMNTAVRVTNGMATDRELPEFLGFMHDGYQTPHTALWMLVVVSCVIAAVGVQSVVGLTGITLASNFGTFILYGLVCIWTIVAFKGRKDFNFLKHGLIPAAGLLLNVLMLGAIIYLYTIGNDDSKSEAKICFYIAGAWALLSFLYVMVTSVKKNYGMKMISAMIRPEKLSVLVEVLKDEELVLGMTVTKVHGFGRQNGLKATKSDKINFVPKIRVDIVANDWDVPHVMDVMREVLNTGTVGDGKIFVLDAKEAMRVRTGETGVNAV